jgi:hypothetical protein
MDKARGEMALWWVGRPSRGVRQPGPGPVQGLLRHAWSLRHSLPNFVTFAIRSRLIVVVLLSHTCFLFSFMHSKVETKTHIQRE